MTWHSIDTITPGGRSSIHFIQFAQSVHVLRTVEKAGSKWEMPTAAEVGISYTDYTCATCFHSF